MGLSLGALHVQTAARRPRRAGGLHDHVF